MSNPVSDNCLSHSDLFSGFICMSGSKILGRDLLMIILFISLHSHLETAFFCAPQNGFDYFHADILIGQQISDNIQYALT